MQFFENKKYIFIVALLIRIIIVGLYGDTRWEHEYNTLIYNLLNGTSKRDLKKRFVCFLSSGKMWCHVGNIYVSEVYDCNHER